MAGEKSLLIDISKCVGCYSCYAACKQWNNLSPATNNVAPQFDMGSSSAIRPYNWLSLIHSLRSGERAYFPFMCLHCTDAPCVNRCPENAISDFNGWKVIDRKHCIACGECVDACPYGAIAQYSGFGSERYEDGQPYKCDGCMSNYSRTPLCAQNCPTGALIYDYRLKLISQARKRVAVLKDRYPEAEVFGLDQHEGTNILIIACTAEQMNVIKKRKHYTQYRNGATLSLYRLLSFFTGRRRFFSKHLYNGLSFITTGNKRKS